MTVTVTIDGQPVAEGRNLRVIRDYGRRTLGVHAMFQRDRELRVYFANGAECRIEFADASVLRDWITNRIRYGRGRWSSQ